MIVDNPEKLILHHLFDLILYRTENLLRMYSSTKLLIILSILSISAACVFYSECPVALKYIEKRRNDDKTRTILRNAYCGIAYRNGRREGKVDCEKIPDFEDVPEGCIPLSQCSAAQELIRTRQNEASTIALLRSSACSLHVRADLINCKKIEQGMPAKATASDLSSDNCGIQHPASKIAMGEKADFEDFPWMALLLYKNESDHVVHRCHGTLINKRYVITAAHCVTYSSAAKRIYGSLHKIILGEYNTSSEQDCLPPAFGGYCTDPVQEFKPIDIHIHPNFTTPGAISDIALIRLDREARFSDFVRAICLPLRPLNVVENDILQIGGWGKTENRLPSEVKLKAKIRYLSKTRCSQYNVDATQLCAGSTNGVDTCKGDSGGPLMFYKKAVDGEVRNFLVGIVSLGGKCGSGAAIYTNVAEFIQWINKTIRP